MKFQVVSNNLVMLFTYIEDSEAGAIDELGD